MQVPTIPALDGAEPSVLVSMSDELVVIRPPRRVDVDTTRVLVDAAASAITAGAVVMVDLDRGPTGDSLRGFRPRQDTTATAVDCASRGAEVLGAGWVRLSTRHAFWTLDVARGRLFQADTLIDPHFVAEREWTAVRAFWITCTHVTALTEDGTYVSTRTSWTSATAPELPIPA